MGIVSLDRHLSGMVLCANPWSLFGSKSYEHVYSVELVPLALVCLCLSLSVFVLFAVEKWVVGASPFRPQVWYRKTPLAFRGMHPR